MSTPVADGTRLERYAVTQQNVRTGQKILQKRPDKPERCRMFRMPDDIETADNTERQKTYYCD
jgi:hypothetical protein